MTAVGRHFVLREFESRDGATVPPRARQMLEALVADYLDELRDEFGPVAVTSGYRTRAVNAAASGAARSFHRYDLPRRYGVAADVVCAQGTPAQWHAFLQGLGPGGLGRYDGFVHVDNRRGHARWRG